MFDSFPQVYSLQSTKSPFSFILLASVCAGACGPQPLLNYGASRDVCSFITGQSCTTKPDPVCLKLFKGAAAHGDGDVLEEVLEVHQQ